MTTRLFLRVAARRWYVLLAGLVLIAACAGWIRVAQPPTYWTRTVVTVLQPEENPLWTDSYSAVGLASLLVVRANGGPAPVKQSFSAETSLYGEGILDGSRVRIRDVGNQWTSSIPEPVIYVEAVGPSVEVVTTRVTGLTDALAADLDELQDNLEVRPGARAFLQLTPETPQVLQVQGSPTRALAATIIIGCILTMAALFWVQRRWPIPESA